MAGAAVSAPATRAMPAIGFHQRRTISGSPRFHYFTAKDWVPIPFTRGMTALQASRISTTMASGKPRPPRTLPTLPPFCPKNLQNEADLLGSPSARHPLEARRPQDAHNPFGQPLIDGGKLLPP